MLVRLNCRVTMPTVSNFLDHFVHWSGLKAVWPDWLAGALVEQIICDKELSTRTPLLIAETVFEAITRQLLHKDVLSQKNDLTSDEIIQEHLTLATALLKSA